MQIQLHIHDGTATLALQGRFGFEDHNEVRATIYPLIQRADIQALCLDMAGITQMDSSSLGMLLLLRERALAAGKRIRLERISPSAMAILRGVQFGKLFDMAPESSGAQGS